MKLKRNREKMMSICLTRIPISGLGEPNIYHDSGVFYKNVGILQECRDFNWRMFYCEEFVGIAHRG